MDPPGSPPAVNSSAGMPQIPSAVPILSLEIGPLTSVRESGSSLIGGSGNGISIIPASKLTSMLSRSGHLPSGLQSPVKKALNLAFTRLGMHDEGHLLRNVASSVSCEIKFCIAHGRSPIDSRAASSVRCPTEVQGPLDC